jgi:HSP20 family protein
MNETKSTGSKPWKGTLVVVLLCAVLLLQLSLLFQHQQQSRSALRSPTPIDASSAPARWFSKLIPWHHPTPTTTTVTPETVWDGSIQMARIHNHINRMFEQAFRDSLTPTPASAIASPLETSDGGAAPELFAMMRDMRREIDGMFTEALRDTPRHAHGFDEGWADLTLTPGISVHDTGGVYEVIVTLPSVDKSDIQLGLDGSILTLIVGRQATRQTQDPDTAHPAVHAQRITRFEQRLRLPGAGSNPENSKATFQNGILRITIPRQAEGERNAGTIKVN